MTLVNKQKLLSIYQDLYSASLSIVTALCYWGKGFCGTKNSSAQPGQMQKESTGNSLIQYFISFVGFISKIILEYMNDIDYSNMCINCTYPPI